MLRELQVNVAKNVPAEYTAKVDMMSGMGVQIDSKDGVLTLPETATAENIYFLEKERVAEGVYAGVTDLSDYFEQFVAVEAGEFAKAIPAYTGEIFGTDQYDTALTEGDIGKMLAVGTDGKWTAAAAASRFEFIGFQPDGSHILAKIRVLDTAKTGD